MVPKISTLRSIILLLLALMLSLVTNIQSKPSKQNAFEFINNVKGCHKGQNVSGLHHLKQYLENFGYLHNDDVVHRNHKHDNNVVANNHTNNDVFDDALESAVKSYQRNFHLEVTGTLDSATVKQMTMPRCGIPDVINNNNTKKSTSSDKKVYKNRKLINFVCHYSFFQGNPRWQKSRLTYRFRSSASVAPGMENVRSACASAFQKWARVSHFTFEEVSSSSQADIEIGFHGGNHGDNYPFDGFGRTLAHAFAPSRGWLHFDADESWSVNPGRNQVDLESVAVHEIRHVLGLGHEPNIPNAIMYPTFSYGATKRDLHEDDVRGIRALYGLN